MIYAQGGSGNGYAAADLNQDGTFNAGDALILLTDVNSISDISTHDILTY
jgi:hypothetical protein